MFTAIGCFFIRRYYPADDVEDRISAIAFAVDDLALLKSDNRRHNGEAGAFIISQEVVHTSCGWRPRIQGTNRWPMTAHRHWVFRHPLSPFSEQYDRESGT